MDSKQASQVTTGLLVVTVGLMMLAGQLNMGLNFGKLWPMIFVVLGVGQFVSRPSWERRQERPVVLVPGGIFLLHNFRIVALRRLVAALHRGGWPVDALRRKDGRACRREGSVMSDAELDGVLSRRARSSACSSSAFGLAQLARQPGMDRGRESDSVLAVRR